MGTPFSTIYDLALVVIRDYRLNHLYENDQDTFNLFMQGLTVKSIPKFTNCLQSLDYTLDDEPSFVATLTNKEIDIVADLVAITWFETNINDATQVNLHLQGRDKKTNAESSNLKEKSEYFDRLREKVKQDMNDYLIEDFDPLKNGW